MWDGFFAGMGAADAGAKVASALRETASVQSKRFSEIERQNTMLAEALTSVLIQLSEIKTELARLNLKGEE